jgi:hypothetical protein
MPVHTRFPIIATDEARPPTIVRAGVAGSVMPVEWENAGREQAGPLDIDQKDILVS